MSFFSGPQAAYSNPPIRPQYYSPRYGQITAIVAVNTFTTLITTGSANQFVVGQLVRFIIPFGDGMEQLNEQKAFITSIVDTQNFNVNLDTTRFTAFNAAGNSAQLPLVLPIGDTNSGAINSSGRINNLTYISGSFINISPN